MGLEQHSLGCRDGSLTFLLLGHPRRGLDRLGQAHVVLGEHPEVVLSAGQDGDGAAVVEQVLRHRPPGLLVRVLHGHHVAQPVVTLLVGGGHPAEGERPWDVLLQLHRARGLGVVWGTGGFFNTHTR